MAGRIENLEIFAAGTWVTASGQKTTITEQDLDDIVSNFSALEGSNVVKPHLKLGHTDAQRWFGQKNGIPSLGWVERVWRQGAKLFANVRDIPDALLGMIKAGRYHNVSVEIMPPGTIEHQGQKFGKVLSAVALLGAEMPAVKNLAGLAAALFSDEMQPAAFADGIEPICYSSPQMERGMFTQEQVDSLVAAAVQKAVDAVKAEFSAKITDLEVQVKAGNERAEQAEAKVVEVQNKAAFSEAEKIVDDAIKSGKLLPAQKDFAMAFCTQKTTMNFGGKDKSPAELFSDFINAGKAQVDTKEKLGSDGKEKSEFATAAQEVHAKTQELQKADSKLSYSDARSQVLTSDPALAERYANAV